MEEKVLYRKKLQDLVSRKIGYGVVQPGDNVNGGIPVIKVRDIVAGLPSRETLDCTTPEIESAYSRTRLHGGEIVLSIVGTIGKTCIVPPEFKGSNLVRATALIDIANPTISKWVKYYIDSPVGQNYIQGNLNTTVQPTLNIKTLAEMEIPFYQQEYMEKAVCIMSAIEEKIKLNNRINHNLPS